jgi:peroxiredoxin
MKAMESNGRAKALLLSIVLLVCVALLTSCGVTVRPTVAKDYDWAGTNRILVLGIAGLTNSHTISETLAQELFENGLPVVRRDVASVLEIYDVGRQERADVLAYGELSEVDVYYPHHHGTRSSTYPIKTVQVELQFFEAETRRSIWKGTGKIEDSAHIADEFLINRLVAEMVEGIVPQWSELPRGTSDAPMLKIGQDAPLFTVHDLDGRPYALKDDLGDNVIVLSFWSFFCDQCKEEIRLLEEVNLRYADSGVKIIAVSIEGDVIAGRVKEYVDASGYSITFLMDEHANGHYEVADAYKIPGTPALYVIGRSGRIVFVRSGHVTTGELSEEIEKQIGKR